MLTLTAVSRSDVGLVREHNEDSSLVTDTLVAVADGLGGAAAGEVASRIAVERLAELPAMPHPDDLIAAIVDANTRIVESVVQQPEREGMGTTVTGLGVVRLDGVDQCAIFNVGDSRVYRLTDDVFERVTVDHSEVEELVAAGVISSSAAATHPRRNVVTRCLGTVPAPQPDVWVHRPRQAERYVVCSDGLSNEVADDDIASALRLPDLAEVADVLVRTALESGGRDNVTVVVADVTLTAGDAADTGDTGDTAS